MQASLSVGYIAIYRNPDHLTLPAQLPNAYHMYIYTEVNVCSGKIP